MQVLFSRCAGVDVHKDSVVACVLIEAQPPQIRTFATTTAALLGLSDWLASLQVTHVAMESTGVYWKAPWNLLEGRFQLLLVNAHHIKQVPGRKTDVCDSHWIADLLRHGLLRPSFVPDRPQRELRDLTRLRTQLVGERARAANRIQKVLEAANVKLSGLVSDILGISGKAMLKLLSQEQTLDAQVIAQEARGVLRKKLPQLKLALEGHVGEHHRFMLRMLLEHVEHLEGQIELFERRIEQAMLPFGAELRRLDEHPGINRRAAHVILAEIGTDMSRFPTAQSLASWAGLCSGNDQSAGKRRSGRCRHGNGWLRQMLCQCAWAAARTKASYYHEFYGRIKARRGHKRALIAVAHSMLVTIWHLISRQSAYVDLGAQYFHRVVRPQSAQHLVARLQRMGFAVTLTPAA